MIIRLHVDKRQSIHRDLLLNESTPTSHWVNPNNSGKARGRIRAKQNLELFACSLAGPGKVVKSRAGALVLQMMSSPLQQEDFSQ